MSQVNSSNPRPADPAESSHTCRAPATAATRAAPAAQARYDFDAALQRAQDYDEDERTEPQQASHAPSGARRPREADAESDPRDALDALGPLNPFAGLPQGALPASAVAAADALHGAMPSQLPVPTSQAGLSAQTQAGQTIAGGPRQFSLALPADASAAALSLRMTQAGANHWQLRLSADAATRQQLAPHVERLRDRLRQRQGRHTADFELEDDGGG